MKAKLFTMLMVALCTVGLAGTALAQQLLLNPGFENWTVNGAPGPPDNWSLSATGITAPRASAIVRTGTYSCRIRTTVSNRYLHQTVNVNPSACYRFSFYAQDTLAADTVSAAVTWFDSSGVFISTISSAKVQVPSGQWKWVSTGNRWSPANAMTARAEIHLRGGGLKWVWVDDASFRHIVNLTPIIDIQYNDLYQSGYPKDLYDCYPSLWIFCPLIAVIPGGIVTAVQPGAYPNFYMQDGEEEWCGIFVYDTSVNPAVGDCVTITAEVAEYYGMTEMKYVSDFDIISSGNPLPEPLDITTGDLAGGCNANSEAYEGCLVRVRYVTCTQEVNTYGEWYVDDGTGECQIDDKLFHYEPSLGQHFNYIIGVVDYSYGEYEILPRDIADIMVPIELLSFEATAHDGYVALTWETASEVNAHSFNIYRDGEKIATVPALGEAHHYRYVDRTVTNGMPYSYQLSYVDLDGAETMYEVVCTVTPTALPRAYYLSQNYPNPFNPVTEITFVLPEQAHVTLKVYNLTGQEVVALVDGERDAGWHMVSWNGRDSHNLEVASGIYFYRMETKGFSATKKMVFLK